MATGRHEKLALHAKILTALRSGGEYEEGHVERLREQCSKHAPDVEFQCLTDLDGTLRHGWPGWWCKMELFRVTGPVLYMDLDTTVVGDIGPLLGLAECHRFIALRDFNPAQRDMGSGLMAWNGDISFLYVLFAHDPERHMAENRSGRWLGDQGFIDRNVGHREHWQNLLPGAVVSYKKHCLSGVPKDARVVCYHGKPRPWEVEG